MARYRRLLFLMLLTMAPAVCGEAMADGKALSGIQYTTNSLAWPAPRPVPTPLPGVNIAVHGSIGGGVPDLSPQGRYLYRCEGCTLTAVDTQTSGTPVVGRISLPERAAALRTNGNNAYVFLVNGGLCVVDISNPMDLSHKSSLASPIQDNIALYSATLAGNLLCYQFRVTTETSDYYHPTVVVDISNPAAPVVRSTFDQGFFYDMTLDGGILYCTSEHYAILRIDLSHPETPHVLPPIPLSGYPRDIMANAGYLYVAKGESGLEIFDIHRSGPPERVGSHLPAASTGHRYDYDLFLINDGQGWILCNHHIPVSYNEYGPIWNYQDSKLIEFDLADLTFPKEIKTIDLGSLSKSAFYNQELWVTRTDGTRWIYDLDSPANPNPMPSFNPLSAALFTVSGQLAYAGDGKGSLQAIGLESNGQPYLIGKTLIPSNIGQISAHQGLLYGATTTETKILDLGDLAHPRQVGVIGKSGSNYSFSSDRLCIGYTPSLWLYSIQAPANSVLKGVFFIDDDVNDLIPDEFSSHSYEIGGMSISSNTISVAVNDYYWSFHDWSYNHGEEYGWEWIASFWKSHFEIIDFTNPAAPRRRGILNQSEELSQVVSTTGYACCLAGEGNKVKIFDSNNLDTPTLASQLSLPMYARKLALKDNLLYAIGQHGTSDADGMLVVADISDPAAPVICAQQHIPRIPRQIALGNGIIFITAGSSTGAPDCSIFAYSYTGPKPLPPLAISGLDRADYAWSRLQTGAKPYLDRPFTFTAPYPSGLANQIYLQTRNDDKNLTTVSLSFTVNRPVRVFVALSAGIATRPSWLSGWRRHACTLTTNDPVPGRILYYRDFPAGCITLGPNRDPAMPLHYSMYSVFVVPTKSAAADWERYQ